MIHKHFDKASWTARGLLPLCLALLLPFMTACSSFEQELIDKNVVPLTIYIQAANSQTRAYIGDVTSENGEDAIKTIKVWLFDNGTNVGYSESITLNTVTVSVPQSIVSKGSVDVYVIANPASVELQGLDATTTEAQLTQAILGGTNFTAANPTTAVPEAGLPMSRIVKGCQINNTGVTPTLPEIKLTRAVSKIRFAFARTEGHTGQVLGIKLTGSMIASSEYIFPVDPSDEANAADYTAPYQGDLRANIVTGSYEDAEMLLGKTDDSGTPIAGTETAPIKVSEADPATLTWANNSSMDAQTYNNLMTPYVNNTVYLRESDRQIWGEVYYRLTPTSPVKKQEFRMISPSDVQDFARNHIWIVYGYFLGDKFNLIVQTIPWEDSYLSVDYTQTIAWKEGTRPEWMPALTPDNSGTETINGTDYTVLYVNGGDTPSLAFTLDAPVGWEWMAVLEPMTDGAGDFISFTGGSSVAHGSVGQASLLNINISETSTTVTHRARLRLYVRTASGDQSREVQSVKYIISRNI